MKTVRIVEDVVRRVHEAMPLPELGEDLRRNVGEAIGAALERADLVTREEFEVQLELLAEAQERVRALEARIEAIERGGGPDAPPAADAS